jgi:hypothetical protein
MSAAAWTSVSTPRLVQTHHVRSELERVPSTCSDPAAQSVGENEDYLASPECSQH